MKKQVLFKKHNLNMSGNLHLPNEMDDNGKYPALIVLHPAGEVKEQTAAVSLGIEYSRDELGGELKPLQISRLIFITYALDYLTTFMKENQFETFPFLFPIFRMITRSSSIYFAPIKKKADPRVRYGRYKGTVWLIGTFTSRFLYKRRNRPSAIKACRRTTKHRKENAAIVAAKPNNISAIFFFKTFPL